MQWWLQTHHLNQDQNKAALQSLRDYLVDLRDPIQIDLLMTCSQLEYLTVENDITGVLRSKHYGVV